MLDEASRTKEDLHRRTNENDQMRGEVDRMRHVESDNNRLKTQVIDQERQIATTIDRLRQVERENDNFKVQISENNTLMNRFGEDIRMLDIEVDRKRKEQEVSDREIKTLREQLEDMKHLEAKFD